MSRAHARRPRAAGPPRRRVAPRLEALEDRTLLDGGPIVTVTAPVPTAVETVGAPATFRVSRTGPTDQPLVVAFTLGGQATAGVDYNRIVVL